MTLVPSTAASAVYSDALTTARGFRTLCFFVLLLAVLLQLALFFTARYGDGVVPVQGQAADSVTVSLGDERATASSGQIADWIYVALNATLWLGMVFSILLALTLVFTTLVMLNGRTVGVARVARAFLWSLLVVLLFFPWQAVLNHPTLAGGRFHVPGVLYTWPELEYRAMFANADWVGWMRFVVWPVVALVLLFVTWAGSGRGVREALGEDLPPTVEDGVDRPVS